MRRKNRGGGGGSLRYALRLVEQISEHRGGSLLQQRHGQVVDRIEGLLKLCLDKQRFLGLAHQGQETVLRLYCATWKLLPDDADFAARMTDLISDVLSAVVVTSDDTAESATESNQRKVACIVVRDLLPSLPASIAMSTIGRAVLSMAADAASDDPSMAVTLVHAISTVRVRDAVPSEKDEVDDDSDDIFFLEHASACSLEDAQVDRLLKACLIDVEAAMSRSDEERAQLMACSRTAAFVAAVGGDDEDNKRLIENYKRVSRWFLRLFQKLDATDAKDESCKIDAALVLSMAIESMARLSDLAAGYLNDSSTIKAAMEKATPFVLQHLKRNPGRLWALKGVSAFVAALQTVGLQWNEDIDAVFELLTPNLRHHNHFRRLHTLKILSSYPKRPFVVDHADLDLSEDLDEEASAPPTPSQNKAAGPTGLCNVMDSLLAIESTPADLKKERYLVSEISRVGVLGRTGKLPVLYAEAAVAHLLGVLYIKFTPLWAAAVKALVGLAKGHEDCVWPALHQQIELLVQKAPYNQVADAEDNETAVFAAPAGPIHFYSMCSGWESSQGDDTLLFNAAIKNSEEHGRKSRHLCTDDESVFQSLWSVTEGAPQLIAAHSRTVVPIFLDFLQNQYFVVYSNDPDARELGMAEIPDNEPSSRQNADPRLDSRAVQRRLVCMLKAFSSVNGPQQLFKHKFLLSVFVSLVGHQDTPTSQTALSCVLRFKLPYLIPLSDTLNNFYEKGKLRDTLMQVKSIDDSGTLDEEHRRGLLPIISRILFGRFSARAIGKKSSKDSPAARRTAVLSFLSEFCKSSDELYPFLYLMTRVYIPLRFDLVAVEMQSAEDRVLTVERISAVSADDCRRIRVQIHQGFLNALEVVLSQFGRKVEKSVPTFMSILLALCKAYEVKDSKVIGEEAPTGEASEDSVAANPADRGGTIRSLCYRRLADIFSLFSQHHDLTVYSEALWGSLRQSLVLLPVMIINSDNAPSLLLLLKTISSEETLVQMLNDDEMAVPSVLKCLSGDSRPAVVDATLSFIDNLLLDSDGSPSSGRDLLQCHIGLLLDQFRLRLGGEPMANQSESKNSEKTTSLRSLTWRRELAILCRVSELMDDRSLDSEGDVMQSLCSLLIPFLDHRRGTADTDKLNVLEVLDKIVSKVPAESAEDFYGKLAIFLGPYKAKAGIGSREVRKSLASVLDRLAASSYSAARAVTRVLVDLCAISTKRVDEMDYDRVIPALSGLGDSTSDSFWFGLSKVNFGTEPSLLLPVVQICFNFLYDEDGVVSRTAFRALKSLVVLASVSNGQRDDQSDDENKKWKKLLEGCVVPIIRSGIAARDESARKFFILLLRETSRCNKDSPSPNLYGDLGCLIRDDEPDLDFFLSITHVQIHRRARALQRLRKLLTTDHDDTTAVPLSPQSLSNVLLPLATHPVYESKMKIEESFALEGIATVGAIARHLSWSKYSATLWTHLTQFDRHPDQEKYLISLICAIIDGFHFDVAVENGSNDSEQRQASSSSAVWRALENRIIPKIEGLLTKEKVERNGQKVKMLRSPVVLAQLKLFCKLPTKLFEAKLPRLLTVICDALRSRDSDARDIARTSLAKMVVEIDMIYLADVVRELATSLTEGYKLHVRTATLHSILLELSKVYTPHDPMKGEPSPPAFDKTVPALLDLIQQDLFGEAQERRDAQGNQVRFVKEAGGSKSLHALELIASMILFKPSASSSSVHMMVSPMLERLRNPLEPTKVIRRIKESLSRIVNGLLRNPSLKTEDLLRFVQATIQPFVGEHEIISVMASMDDGLSSDDEEAVKPIRVSGRQNPSESGSASTKGDLMEWRPSTLKSAKSTRAARYAKSKEEAELARCNDGASAPKLTGSRRNLSSGSQNATRPSVNDPATISAVIFGLQLLNPTLKKSSSLVASDGLVDAFVPLLTTCVCRCRDTEVVLLSLRCLGWLLKSDQLPSLVRCSKSLASKTLDLLTSAGANQELSQATFKMLTLLLQYDQKAQLSAKAPSTNNSNGEKAAGDLSIPLDDEQMQILISYLQESVVSSDQHNAAISLIKAIMFRRYLSAEMYDLMETMLEQSVRSPKATVREHSGQVFLNYLLNYPLADDRIEQHLKQVVLNLSYEHAEGRHAAIGLTTNLLEKLPVPLVEKHCQLFFLPLTLQLANDESQDCREACAKCARSLLKRLSTDVLKSIYGYIERWSKGDAALRRMALQLFGIVVETRSDFAKRGDTLEKLFATVQRSMKDNEDEWENIYFSLILMETIGKAFHNLDTAPVALWEAVIASMTHNHAWIKLASSRLVTNQLQSLNPKTFVSDAPKLFLASLPGSLHLVARNLCFQIGVDEDEQSDELTALVVKSLTWVLQAMKHHPELCFGEGEDESRDPALWVFTRLSNIARPKGTKRRQAVFKCFAAFASFCGDWVFDYLELLLEPLHRTESETRNELELPSLIYKARPTNDTVSEEAKLAKDVLHLLEELCENQEGFLKAYAAVKTRAREKKEKRKLESRTEAVVDPQNAAKQRIQKQEREKKRRKRRVEERRMGRGVKNAKRRYL